ncbi:hypothetical protein ABS642_14380 [Microbacterium sp. A8/3-1]|uniref:DUF4352 domain-containing protein n=1 Tax=Microbacterium sp. A8/3-1 TaxID=3160749 RepID=A0AAU7VSN3_9MICO
MDEWIAAWLAQEPAVRISSIALLVAICSAAAGIMGAVNGARALRLAKKQDSRKKPNLNVTYEHGSWEATDAETVYSVRVLVRNPSDSANAVSDAELLTTYSVGGRHVPLRIPRDTASAILPAQLTAGGSAQLNLQFTARPELYSGRNAEGFRLYLVDTHGTELLTDLGYIQARTS